MMFEAADQTFVKSVGKGSLLPVRNLELAGRCKPLAVVVKKNRPWYTWWRSPKYEVTEFSINDLLHQGETPVSIPTETTELLTYNGTHKFELSGKIGAQLKELFDLELSGKDTVNVDAKFGKIQKVEVPQPKLMAELDKRSISLDHQYVKQIRENSRKILCIVTDVVETTQDSTIHTSVDYDIKEDVKTGKAIPKVVSGEEDAEVNGGSDRKFSVPKETCLGYSVCEMRISTSGKLQLVAEEGVQGAWDTPDGSSGFEDVHKALKAFTDCPDKNNITKLVISLCQDQSDIKKTHKLIRNVQKGRDAKLGNSVKSPDVVKKLLASIGLQMNTDTSTWRETPNKKELISSCEYLLAALEELDDDVIKALVDCSPCHMTTILNILKEKDLSVESPVNDLVKDDCAGRRMIYELGFNVVDDRLTAPRSSKRTLHAAYVAVYGLEKGQET